MAKPINVEGTALYNYTEGYGSYLIPAVMMIIIFQTLLMVIGMVTGEEYSSDGIRTYAPFGHTWAAAIRIVAGKAFVYCGLYAIFSFFLLGLLPYFFSIPNIGNGLYIVLLMIPYLIATSFLGLAASRYFTDSEAPLLPNGVNALVLESGTLYSSGSSCNTCFCTIKFNGSKYG